MSLRPARNVVETASQIKAREQQEASQALNLLAIRDIRTFARDVLKVEPNPAQEAWWPLLFRLEDNGNWFYREVVHWAANRIGKTLGLAIAILFAAHTKWGIARGDTGFWLSQPYRVLHLGPTHPIALQMLNDEILRLLHGSHLAQGGRIPQFPAELWSAVQFEGQYPGIKLWNGSEIHFRTTDERAKGVSAMTAHVVSIDEAALEDYLIDTLDQTLRMRVSTTNGPLWIVSTPNGLNDFFTLVEDIRTSSVQRNNLWLDDRGRRALMHSTIEDNVGFGISREQVNYLEGAIEPAMREVKLRGAFLEPRDAFFVPQEAVANAFSKSLKQQAGPQSGHHYVIFWDVSVTSDPTVCIILDVTTRPWRGVHFLRWPKPMAGDVLVEEMLRIHEQWRTPPAGSEGLWAPRVVTGYDATSMGGHILRDMLRYMRPQRPVQFTQTVKNRALTNARAAMTTGRLLLPAEWTVLQREVFNYRKDDKRIQQDAVMALAGAVHVAAAGFSGITHAGMNVSWVDEQIIGEAWPTQTAPN